MIVTNPVRGIGRDLGGPYSLDCEMAVHIKRISAARMPSLRWHVLQAHGRPLELLQRSLVATVSANLYIGAISAHLYFGIPA